MSLSTHSEEDVIIFMLQCMKRNSYILCMCMCAFTYTITEIYIYVYGWQREREKERERLYNFMLKENKSNNIIKRI